MGIQSSARLWNMVMILTSWDDGVPVNLLLDKKALVIGYFHHGLLIETVTAHVNTGIVKSTYFFRVKSTNNLFVTSNTSWLGDTIALCIVRCLSNFPSCDTITYNPGSAKCTKVSLTAERSSNSAQLAQKDMLFMLNSNDLCSKKPKFHSFAYKDLVNCLYISTHELSFTAANKTCFSQNSTLYTAETEEKLGLLHYVVENITKKSTWIGLTDIHEEGNFIWATGKVVKPFHLNWANYQPDNYHDEEDCAEIGNWPGKRLYNINDSNCDKHNAFICEVIMT